MHTAYIYTYEQSPQARELKVHVACMNVNLCVHKLPTVYHTDASDRVGEETYIGILCIVFFHTPMLHTRPAVTYTYREVCIRASEPLALRPAYFSYACKVTDVDATYIVT